MNRPLPPPRSSLKSRPLRPFNPRVKTMTGPKPPPPPARRIVNSLNRMSSRFKGLPAGGKGRKAPPGRRNKNKIAPKPPGKVQWQKDHTGELAAELQENPSGAFAIGVLHEQATEDDEEFMASPTYAP